MEINSPAAPAVKITPIIPGVTTSFEGAITDHTRQLDDGRFVGYAEQYTGPIGPEPRPNVPADVAPAPAARHHFAPVRAYVAASRADVSRGIDIMIAAAASDFPTGMTEAPFDTGTAHGPAERTILDETVAFLRRFIVFQDPTHYRLAARWIIHTHAFQAAQATPYLYVKSAEPQSGKTRSMEVIEMLARNSYRAANMTQGALYAAIETKQPTVLIDEVDAIFSGAAKEDLRGMLNAGYKVGGSVSRQVMRKGGERDVEDYNVFCPKMLAGIDNGAIPATIADRCMVFDLKRKKRDETVERLNYRIVRPEAEELKSRIAHWVAKRLEILAVQNVKDIPEISDRAFEIAEPLLQIGMLLPGDTRTSREDIVHIFSQQKPAETIQTRALRVAKALFAEGDRDRISSVEFAAAMDIPSVPKASRILTPYGITTTTIVFPGGLRSKGYHRGDFVDAWERYL